MDKSKTRECIPYIYLIYYEYKIIKIIHYYFLKNFLISEIIRTKTSFIIQRFKNS